MTDPHDTLRDPGKQREQAKEFFKQQIGIRIDNMIDQGFPGWEGTLTSHFGYTLQLDMRIIKK